MRYVHTPLFLVTLRLTRFALLARHTNTVFDTRAKSTEITTDVYATHEPGLATAVEEPYPLLTLASMHVRCPLLCDSV